MAAAAAENRQQRVTVTPTVVDIAAAATSEFGDGSRKCQLRLGHGYNISAIGSTLCAPVLLSTLCYVLCACALCSLFCAPAASCVKSTASYSCVGWCTGPSSAWRTRASSCSGKSFSILSRSWHTISAAIFSLPCSLQFRIDLLNVSYRHTALQAHFHTALLCSVGAWFSLHCPGIHCYQSLV